MLELLRHHAEPTYSYNRSTVVNKTITIHFNLNPGEVKYFEISVSSHTTNTKFARPDEFKLWDKQMGEISK